MDALVERLNVAVEQIRGVRRSIESEGQGYRLDIALQALEGAIGLLQSSLVDSSAHVESPGGDRDAWPIKVIWERPNKHQKFEGWLFKNGKIRLSDGRGPFTPSGACKALVQGSFNGLRDWKYWQEGEKQGEGEWLPIKQLEQAGEFD